MKRSILLCVGIAAAVPIFLFPKLADGDVIFEKIAGPNVEAPTGGMFDYLYSGSLDADRTVFHASTTLWLEGIWAHETGEIVSVVDTDTLIPGSVVHFSNFGDYAQHDDDVAFFGGYPEYCDMGPCGGIFRATADGLTRIVDTNDTVPGRGDTFEYLGMSAIDADDVAFLGGMVIDTQGYPEYEYGVYADLGSGLVTVADWETPTPFGTGHLYLEPYDYHVGLYDGEVFFKAWNTGDWWDGFYAWDPASDTYRVLRNANTLVPGTQSYFDWTDDDAFRNGTYAFIGHYWSADYSDYRDGIFADFGDGLIEIVGDDELHTDWYAGAVDFEDLSVDGDTIAFTIYDYWAYGINRLYLYDHATESLTRVIGSGDELDGRIVERVEIYWHAASEKAVAFMVDFQNYWERELWVATLHSPAHELIAGTDVDGSGFGELLLLRQVSDYTYQLQMRDAYTGGMPGVFSLGDYPVYDMALVENPGQAPSVAAYSKNTNNGQLLVKLHSLPGGGVAKKLKIYKHMKPISLAVLPDFNGNGAPEVVAMAESPKPFIRIRIMDTATAEVLNAIKHGKSVRPVAVYATEDLDASGTPEIVILGEVRSTAKVRIIVQDAADGTIVSDFYAGYYDKAPVLDAMMVEDINGDGKPEFALARERPGKGKSGYEIRDLMTGAIVVDRMRVSDSRPLKTVGIEDMNADGMAELGLLMVDADGVTSVEIHDMMTKQLIHTIDMLAVEDGMAVVTTPDIDTSSAEELVVMGDHFGMDLLEIHDCVDGDSLRYYFVP